MKTLNTLDIKGLFGLYNFSFNFHDKNGFVMLAAPNGYGKSTILKIIRAIFSGNAFFFDELVFEEIHATYFEEYPKGACCSFDAVKRHIDDPQALEYAEHFEESIGSVPDDVEEISEEEYLESLSEEDRIKYEKEKAEEEDQYPNKEALQYEVEIRYCKLVDVEHPNGLYETIKFNNREVGDIAVEVCKNIKELELVGPWRAYEPDSLWLPCWKRKNDSREMSLSELFYEYRMDYQDLFLKGAIKGLTSFWRCQTSDLVYVDADRKIFTSANNGLQMDVSALSQMIRDIYAKLNKKARLVTVYYERKLERELVKRLRRMDGEEVMRARVEALIEKFTALETRCAKYGIHHYRSEDEIYGTVIPRDNSIDVHKLPENCDKAAYVVYEIRLEYLIEELSVYEKFLDRLDTYQKYLDSLLRNVSITLSVEGIVAYAANYHEYCYLAKDGAYGMRVNLNRLSSGEKHLLVLIGLLLFYKFDDQHEENFLVLMDEPEISLHPAWQEALAYFCWNVKSLYNKDFVFATHSPVFVNGYSDRMIDLRDAEVKGD